MDTPTTEAARTFGGLVHVLNPMLQYLSTKDLARARRVSWTWCKEIDRCAVLQQHLFLLPMDEQDYIIWNKRTEVPFHHSSKGCRQKCKIRLVTEEPTNKQLDKRAIIALHPALKDNSIMHTKSDSLALGINSADYLDFKISNSKDMYATQPPVKSLCIQYYCNFEGPSLPRSGFQLSEECKLYNRKGITIQDLAEAVREGPTTGGIIYRALDPLEEFCTPAYCDHVSHLQLRKIKADYDRHGEPSEPSVQIQSREYLSEDHTFVVAARASESGEFTWRCERGHR